MIFKTKTNNKRLTEPMRPSVPVFHPTAPCLPGEVVADLDCEANTFAVRWKGSDEGLEQYTAIAIGSDRSRATCNTTDTNCVIQDLKCGLNYQIVMTTSSVNCGTIEGSDYSMHSGTCVLTAEFICWWSCFL